MVVFTKVVHLDVLLDVVQRIGLVWFAKLEIQGLKVVIRMQMAKVTIISCDHQLSWDLICLGSKSCK